MSSYAYFQYFHSMARLDNFVSGIPNAITKPISPWPADATANADPRLPSPGIPIGYTQVITVLMAACVAGGLETDVKEEANVEF
jgi:hypothetical protein